MILDAPDLSVTFPEGHQPSTDGRAPGGQRIRCSQIGCDREAVALFFWHVDGKNHVVCADHRLQVEKVAKLLNVKTIFTPLN